MKLLWLVVSTSLFSTRMEGDPTDSYQDWNHQAVRLDVVKLNTSMVTSLWNQTFGLFPCNPVVKKVLPAATSGGACFLRPPDLLLISRPWVAISGRYPKFPSSNSYFAGIRISQFMSGLTEFWMYTLLGSSKVSSCFNIFLKASINISVLVPVIIAF